MPGIVGIIGPGEPGPRRSELRLMVQSLIHEPFYSGGTFVNEPLGLWLGWANHRGSFADCQPIWNERQDICLIFSGEDFTDPEDIRALRAAGHDFVAGNASYLVHLYEQKGERFWESLNGRFSGVLVDLRERRGVLFNDRFGLNRIYFRRKEGRFLLFVRSEILAGGPPRPSEPRPSESGRDILLRYRPAEQDSVLQSGLVAVRLGVDVFPRRGHREKRLFPPGNLGRTEALECSGILSDSERNLAPRSPTLFAGRRASGRFADRRQGQPYDYGLGFRSARRPPVLYV